MNTKANGRVAGWRAGLTILAVLVLVGAARADDIDEALVKQARPLLRACRESGGKNVGTLKFKVQVGKQPGGYDVEPLCSNLADRVENLLVILLNPDTPEFAVIHAASRAAAAQERRASFSSLEGRKKI